MSARLSYKVVDRGVNSQGNRWDNRYYGPDFPNMNPYHYSNRDGSYYYSNSDGSKYYNDGGGNSLYWPPPHSAGTNGITRVSNHCDEVTPDTFNQKDDDLAEIFGPDRTTLNTENPRDTDATDSVSSSETERNNRLARDDISDSTGVCTENYGQTTDSVSIEDHSRTERYECTDDSGHHELEDSSEDVGYYDSGYNDDAYLRMVFVMEDIMEVITMETMTMLMNVKTTDTIIEIAGHL